MEERNYLQKQCDYHYEELEKHYDNGDMWEYLRELDIYDTKYVIDSNLEYNAVRVMVAYGGPNVYINTWEGCIEAYSSVEVENVWLSRELCQEIDEYYSEIWRVDSGL